MYRRQRFSRFAGALALALIVARTPSQPGPRPRRKTPRRSCISTTTPGPSRNTTVTTCRWPVTARAPPWLPDATPMHAIQLAARVSGNSWRTKTRSCSFFTILVSVATTSLAASTGLWVWRNGTSAQVASNSAHVQRRAVDDPRLRLPDLLASGERCEGQQIHDQQHPHDLAMEIAAEYNAPLRGATRWQAYVAPAGEPALGPVAFPHRTSRCQTPGTDFTSLLDATHISFGVITAWPVRQPLESRRFRGSTAVNRMRTGPMLISERSTPSPVGCGFLPTRQWALQVSVGKLTAAEPSADGRPGIDITRTTRRRRTIAPSGEQHLGDDRLHGAETRARRCVECPPS